MNKAVYYTRWQSHCNGNPPTFELDMFMKIDIPEHAYGVDPKALEFMNPDSSILIKIREIEEIIGRMDMRCRFNNDISGPYVLIMEDDDDMDLEKLSGILQAMPDARRKAFLTAAKM